MKLIFLFLSSMYLYLEFTGYHKTCGLTSAEVMYSAQVVPLPSRFTYVCSPALVLIILYFSAITNSIAEEGLALCGVSTLVRRRLGIPAGFVYCNN